MEAAFERLYGEHGAWVRLFREQPGYLRTVLLRGERHGHYLTLDTGAMRGTTLPSSSTSIPVTRRSMPKATH
jgi:hypothetical protein